MNEPDDRELEQYLKGDSRLSRRYREAGGESAPPGLDEAILARARAELRRKPNFNRYLAPVALAASLALAVNLAWNISRVEAPPERVPAMAPAEAPAGVPSEYEVREATPAEQPAAAPATPAPARQEVAGPQGLAAPAAPVPAQESKKAEDAATADTREREVLEPHALLERDVQAATRARAEADKAKLASTAVPAAADAAARPAQATPLPESVKIDLLIEHVAGLDGAVFIRNGREYGPVEAAKHLATKREVAGDRVKTADDFIRLCASFSSASGEAYLIRFADGHTRTAEDVLREELARMDGR